MPPMNMSRKHFNSMLRYIDTSDFTVHFLNSCIDLESFVRGGPTLTGFFLLVEMAFCWQAHGGPTLNARLVFQGIQTSVAKRPYIFVIFRGGGGGGGGGGDPAPPTRPLDMCMKFMNTLSYSVLE